MTWQPFANDREVKIDSRGYVIIRPRVRPATVPLFCPICDLMMRTDDDSRRWRENQCCHKCSMKWVDPARERWANGWRPSREEVQDEVAYRTSLPIGVKLEPV